jgi:hypothetical protein
VTKTEMCEKFADLHCSEYISYTFDFPTDEKNKMCSQARQHGYRIAASALGLDPLVINRLMWQMVYKWMDANGHIKQGV